MTQTSAAPVGRRTDHTFGGEAPRLSPPVWVRAEAGGHQVTLTWAEVPGAVGYRVHAADSPRGDYQPLDHAGGDVLVVPHPPYADTTGTPAVARWYRVATLSDAHVEGELSDAVSTAPLSGTSVPVVIGVDGATPVAELRLGAQQLPVELSGDGAGSLVEALAASDEAGEVAVLTWNLTLDQAEASGATGLARRVRVELRGLAPSTAYALRHERVDHGRSDIGAVWRRLKAGEQDRPADELWADLHEAERLDVLGADAEVTADADGSLELAYDLPMPAISLLTLTPQA